MEMPLEAADSGGQIVTRAPAVTLATTLDGAVSSLISAAGLIEFPNVVRRKWLPYLDAFVELLLLCVMLLIAWGGADLPAANLKV